MEMKTDLLVRMRRPDGSTFLLSVPDEHLQRVMDLANGEFGDKSIRTRRANFARG